MRKKKKHKQQLDLDRDKDQGKQEAEVVTGVLHVHPRGFAFLQADDSALNPEDIFVPKHLTQNAVDGDRVEVLVNPLAFSEKGPEGKVITILSRGRTHMAGIIKAIGSNGEFIAHVPLLGSQQRVVVETSKGQELRVGDRIVMKVISWGTKTEETLCSFSHHLGHISDPSCDIAAAIEEYEIQKDFSSKAIEEAKSFGARVLLKEIKKREDLRDWECFTIDPKTAKDFDDALSLRQDDQGHYHLGVHIADVSHYVQPGSTLDQEALERCNSTYFPSCCVPMLPAALSENLCSLKPQVSRLTLSVLMEFDPTGTLANYRIVRSIIKSAKRFTYEEAKEVLDNKRKSRHRQTLLLMQELCHRLKKKRYERGSIEFSLPEFILHIDENGIPQGSDFVAYDITHQLVEEFMLKANEVVAEHLCREGKELTYRVHDSPAEENLRDFAILTNAFGFKISDKPTAVELQKLFDEALQTPYGQYLAAHYIRRMRLAVYSPDNIGHYGLGLTYYCHFTSPIRRYIDLVIHRILCGQEMARKELEPIAQQCSEQERMSSKAENSVIYLKKLRLLKIFQQEEPYRIYEAIITRVKNFGFFFEVLDLMLEGYLHVADLHQDFFVFEEAKMCLRGLHTGTVYGIGERVAVTLRDIDFITLSTKWDLSLAAAKKGKKGKKKKQQKNGKKEKRTRRKK